MTDFEPGQILYGEPRPPPTPYRQIVIDRVDNGYVIRALADHATGTVREVVASDSAAVRSWVEMLLSETYPPTIGDPEAKP